jgi:hypothetical protein
MLSHGGVIGVCPVAIYERRFLLQHCGAPIIVARAIEFVEELPKERIALTVFRSEHSSLFNGLWPRGNNGFAIVDGHHLVLLEQRSNDATVYHFPTQTTIPDRAGGRERPFCYPQNDSGLRFLDSISSSDPSSIHAPTRK